MTDRMGWADLPPAARASIEARFGAVTATETAPPGLTMGVACRVDTVRGPIFVKAGPVDAPSTGQYTAELEVGRRLPAEVAAPRLLHGGTVDGWHVLVYEYMPGRPADLSPGSPDVAAAVDVLGSAGEQMPAATWPGGPHVAARKLTPMLRNATRYLAWAADTPALRRCAAVLDGWDPAELPAETLAHGDIHPGNLHVTGHGIRLIDWGLACHAPAWFDLAGLVVRLIAAGDSPAGAEDAMGSVPAWARADPADVTRFAAVVTGFSAWAAARGPEQWRPQRARTAAAGEAWILHRVSHPSRRLPAAERAS